ncbi:LOW QUALITY PROTEIN: hypothetical protein V1477_004493 [Vespula maculifrons]|uniref:Ribosomal protein S3 n=1 Tax=Vespula maculifrons TaxID=7453 RepID=A0ABD2CLZ2_VESMC
MAPGSLERARRALTEVNRNVVVGKGSSRPLRAYFFRPDRTNRSRVITENRTGVIGKGSSLPLRPYFFRPDWTSRSRVITHLGEPDRGRWKGLVTPTTPIFFSSRSDQREPSYNGLKGKKEKTFFFNNFFLRNYSTQEYRTGVTGKGSSRRVGPYFFRPDRTTWRTGQGSLERARRALYAHIFFVLIGPTGADTQEYRTGVIGKGSSLPIRPYFFRPHQTNRSSVMTYLGEPDRGHWKGLVAPSTPIFFTSRSDQNKGKKNFSSTIFFSETIAPRRTGPGSLERARRSLYAHIFFVLIGPIGADTQEYRTGVAGKGSSLPIRPYFFRPDQTNRSRVITEYRTGVAGKGSSLPIRPYFFRPDQTNRSRVITHLGERYRGHWKGLVAPCTHMFFSSRSDQEQRKNKFFSTIFFSETIAPRRTVPGSLERARRALYAHIFFVQIGPVGVELKRFKGNKGKKNFSSTIFFSETIVPRRTGPGSLERARRSLYAHIFYVQIGPVGADTQENQTWVMGKGSLRPLRPYFFRPDRTNRSRVITVTKEKKHFSLTIFFSETIAPTRTGSVSLERARRDLYAHIFFVQIGPIGAELLRTQEYRTGVAGKGSSLPIRPYFFRPDQTNRSRVITHPGEPDQGSWKVLVAPCAPIFFSSRSNQ